MLPETKKKLPEGNYNFLFLSRKKPSGKENRGKDYVNS